MVCDSLEKGRIGGKVPAQVHQSRHHIVGHACGEIRGVRIGHGAVVCCLGIYSIQSTETVYIYINGVASGHELTMIRALHKYYAILSMSVFISISTIAVDVLYSSCTLAV